MQEQTLFIEALEREDPAERAAFLDRACAGDDVLRRRVERLLVRHQGLGGFLDTPALVAPVLLPAGERPGTVIGPFKLLEAIGEGGMGTVFRCEQTQPLRREVALKVIKPGMDSAQVVARFEAERQALALMDHPNIARVLDAGTWGDETRGVQSPGFRRPYFVMELVNGTPITRFCDEHQLTPQERLELFVPVCRAVQHAHQKGIIHRDLKPSNVLVARYDDKPVPKVIDFGVAKALHQRLTEGATFTQAGQLVGTLEYMSPEQASLGAPDVDTRSDVYSLGVLLYELLAGTTPFEKGRLHGTPFDEALRIIREEDPPTPSTRLGTTQELPAIAARRRTEPARLAKLVHGDLDWVVMKCLEKDRTRRYPTADALATDLQRFLADEPVQARPPSRLYRWRKFVRRHRLGVTAAAVLFLGVLCAAGSVGWVARDTQSRRQAAVHALDRALAETERWRQQERWSEASAALARAEELRDVSPEGPAADRVRAARRDLDMVVRLEGIMHELTSLRGSALGFDFAKRDAEYAAAFRAYGIDVEALSPAEAATLVAERDVWPQLAVALDAWAEARRYARLGRDRSWKNLLEVAALADPDPWRVRVRDALRRRDRAGLLKAAEEIPVDGVSPITLGLLGRALNDAATPAQAEALFRRAQRRYPGSFWLNYDLAMALLWQKPARTAEAVRFLSVALSLRPDSLPARAQLGRALLTLGRPDEAQAEFAEAVRAHPDSPDPWLLRGRTYHDLRRLDEALADFTRALELAPGRAEAWCRRGNVHCDAGRYTLAVADHTRAVELDPRNPWPRTCRGLARGKLDQWDQAYADHCRAIELAPDYSSGWNNRSIALKHLGRHAEAVADATKAIELDPVSVVAYMNRGSAYMQLKQYDKAAADYTRATELEPTFARAWRNRAECHEELRQYDQALSERTRVVELEPRNAAGLNALASLLATCPVEKLRNPARAVELAKRAVELAPAEANYWNTLGVAHLRAGAWGAGQEALARAVRLRLSGPGVSSQTRPP